MREECFFSLLFSQLSNISLDIQAVNSFSEFWYFMGSLPGLPNSIYIQKFECNHEHDATHVHNLVKTSLTLGF